MFGVVQDLDIFWVGASGTLATVNDGKIVGCCYCPSSYLVLTVQHAHKCGVEAGKCAVAACTAPEILLVPRFERGSFDVAHVVLVFVAVAVGTKTVVVTECTDADASDCTVVEAKLIPALAVTLLKIDDISG